MPTKATAHAEGLAPFPEDWPGVPSDQLVNRYRSDAAYRALCDLMRSLLEAGASANALKGHPHFAHLAEWFYNRKASFKRVAAWGEPSPELDAWPGLCWHLGPRPHPTFTVHRVDDKKPYVLANLEWASPKRQAIEKRGNRLIKWQGKRVSDEQFIDELKKLGIKDKTPNAVQQFRKNHRSKYANLDALHEAMFQKWRVHSHATKIGDPIEAEPLMPGLGIDWEREKKAKPWMPNIVFQLQHVADREKVILEQLNFHKNDGCTPALEDLLQNVRDFQRKLKNRYSDLMTKKTCALLDEMKPNYAMHAEGFHNYPDAVQSIASAPVKSEVENPPAPVKWAIAGKAEVEEALKLLGL